MDAEIQAEIGRLIREDRERRGLSQAQLGRLSGLSQSAIAGYETGRRYPDRAAVGGLASALGWGRQKIIRFLREKTADST